MKQYIINVPQLQSLPKRFSSFLVTILCWIMWGYLLYPIITVISWINGDYRVINEMRWFGGYKSLLELLQIYAGTLIILGIVWIIWIALRLLCRHLATEVKIVTDEEIANFYHVEKQKIVDFRKQQNVTVFFDNEGQIVDLK